MVNAIAEAFSLPTTEGGAKSDQQAQSSEFVAMLAGAVASRPEQAHEAAEREARTACGEETESAVVATFAGTQAGTRETPPAEDNTSAKSEQAPMDPARAGQVEIAVEPVRAEPAQAELEIAVFAAEAASNSEQSELGNQAASAGEVIAPPETQPTSSDGGSSQDVAEALRDLTVERPRPLPEASKPQSEIAASVIAARLNPMGQNSRTGAVLLRTDDPSKSKSDNSEVGGIGAAASAVAGSRRPEVAPADTATRIQVEWQPTETVTISAPSDGGFGEAFQFASERRQSEPNDLPSADSNQQAFGLEMKSQTGTESVVRQVQSVSTQGTRTESMLGEKMVGQIVQEVSLHKLGDNTTLSVRLDPPELGTLRIKVISEAGVLTTQLESPNAVVRGILETHLPALKDALANAGLEISKFSVSSGLDFGQNAQKQQQAWQPARMAPAVEFDPQMQDMQPVIEAAVSGNQAQAASHSWLA